MAGGGSIQSIVPVPPEQVRPEQMKPKKVELPAILHAAAGGSIVPVEPTLRTLLRAIKLLLDAAEGASEPGRVELYGAISTYLETPAHPAGGENVGRG